MGVYVFLSRLKGRISSMSKICGRPMALIGPVENTCSFGSSGTLALHTFLWKYQCKMEMYIYGTDTVRVECDGLV